MTEVPLKPTGREEIRKLESALLAIALFSEENLEILKNSEERLTWIDSLYISAAALAREKAGMSLTKISEELGLSESSIRKHLKGETKAGKIILEAYEKLSKEGFNLNIFGIQSKINIQELKEKIEELYKKVEEIRKLLS
ncbi:MAG: transcriptional regulator [Nanopusillaceae archaeon]